MFGQGARLPIDLLLRGDEEVDENQSHWLAEHQARLTDAYQRAEEHLKQQAEKRQDQHFEREYNIPIQKGQLVYPVQSCRCPTRQLCIIFYSGTCGLSR